MRKPEDLYCIVSAVTTDERVRMCTNDVTFSHVIIFRIMQDIDMGQPFHRRVSSWIHWCTLSRVRPDSVLHCTSHTSLINLRIIQFTLPDLNISEKTKCIRATLCNDSNYSHLQVWDLDLIRDALRWHTDSYHIPWQYISGYTNTCSKWMDTQKPRSSYHLARCGDSNLSHFKFILFVWTDYFYSQQAWVLPAHKQEPQAPGLCCVCSFSE